MAPVRRELAFEIDAGDLLDHVRVALVELDFALAAIDRRRQQLRCRACARRARRGWCCGTRRRRGCSCSTDRPARCRCRDWSPKNRRRGVRRPARCSRRRRPSGRCRRCRRRRRYAAVAGGDARAFELAREDLDHAADRVRAPVARARTAHDLDALDRIERQLLERERAGVGRRRAHAVDQHQHVIGVRAAQEQRGLLARRRRCGRDRCRPAGATDRARRARRSRRCRRA